MPDIDLEPGDYTERKPKGWRWKLPWSHPEGARLSFSVFLVMVGFVVYFIVNRSAGTPFGEIAGAAMFAFVAGGMFAIWTRS